MRYWSLILIAHWPSRSPPRAWSLFPGGIFNSSTLSTWSSCASLSWALRTACPDTALDLRPIKSFWVSLSLKLLITGGFCHVSYDISSQRLISGLRRHEPLEGARSCYGLCVCDFLSYIRIFTHRISRSATRSWLPRGWHGGRGRAGPGQSLPALL